MFTVLLNDGDLLWKCLSTYSYFCTWLEFVTLHNKSALVNYSYELNIKVLLK